MPQDVTQPGQAGALSYGEAIVAPATVEEGVEIVREWMSANWGAITEDHAEPGIREMVRDLLSLSHKHECRHS
jgi:hypothetical protein